MEKRRLSYSVIVVLIISMLLFIGFNSGESVYTVEESIKNFENLQGEKISIKGEVRKGTISCTQEYCGENNSCCNTCSGNLKLGNETSIRLKGDEIGCSGKSCNMTCQPKPNQEYLFQGNLNQSYGQKIFHVTEYSEVSK